MPGSITPLGHLEGMGRLTLGDVELPDIHYAIDFYRDGRVTSGQGVLRGPLLHTVADLRNGTLILADDSALTVAFDGLLGDDHCLVSTPGSVDP